jgi:hypothetical protein
MKPATRRKDGTSARHIRPHYFLRKRHRRPAPNRILRNTLIAPDFDGACWLETYGGSAITLQVIADRQGDDQ